MKTRNNLMVWILAVICFMVAAIFFVPIYEELTERKECDQSYEEINDQVKPGQDDVTDGDSESIFEEDPPLSVDFIRLGEISGNAIAWIYCPDTVIDYPVAQCEDNAYYLNHLLDDSYNANGCLFADYRNAENFTDDNTLIYGHHMKSGRMFACLDQYSSQEYYEAHPVMYLQLKDGSLYELRLFSGYTTTMDSDSYWRNMDDESVKAEWLHRLIERSDFNAGGVVSMKDHIVTLSTCTYSFQNARYVVHGKLVPLADEMEADANQ